MAGRFDMLAESLARIGRDLGDTLFAGETVDETIRGNISIVTLTVVRWVAIVGQLFTILFVHFSLGIPLEIEWMLPIVGASAIVNIVLWRNRQHGPRLSQRRALLVFAFDIVLLATLVGLSGGLSNPFALLLLLPVTQASATLNKASAYALAFLTALCIAALASLPSGLPWIDGPLDLPRLYLLASWLALSLAVALFVWHMTEITDDARRQESAFSAVQAALAREQQLSALGGQAAAVAHALGTPLATINVIAKELVRELPEDDPLAPDASELLAQARRCREVLSTLGRPDADHGYRKITASPLGEQLRSLVDECDRPPVTTNVVVEVENGVDEPVPSLAPEIRHALTNLIENAISFAENSVVLTLRMGNTGSSLTIDDDGPGFAPEILDWLGEPYNSSRRRSGGLGLGVFIAKSLLARTGARLHFTNNDKGARVMIHWPAGALARETEVGE
ncbi:MAG: ActS/PrrB/RegB family redox-sensitive histidine kinase [Geminicoccaceae bacterium]|nr:ActS/PrrB/RegB family redox-sensitive histidine kinase [Geminicoccaceae bacterium]